MGKKLILGGTGFLGSNLAKTLVARGERPILFARSRFNHSHLDGILDKVEMVCGDFMDESALRKAISGVDIIFHLISTTPDYLNIENTSYDLLANILSTIRLVEISIANGVKKIVFVSSGGTVYGEAQKIPVTEQHPRIPKSAYGQSKLIIENYLSFYSRTTDLDIDILRVSNTYGPGQNPLGGQGIIAVAMGCVQAGRSLKLFGKGEAVRDYIFIDDVVQAMILASEKRGSFIANVSSGIGHSILEIVEAVEKIVGASIDKQFIPSRATDVLTNILANNRAYEIYGWQPTVALHDGLVLNWKWMNRNT